MFWTLDLVLLNLTVKNLWLSEILGKRPQNGPYNFLMDLPQIKKKVYSSLEKTNKLLLNFIP